jgi:regulator of replication initiation timing
MCYGQPNSNSNFPTVVFVVALLIGMGLLIYHSVDLATENNQLKQSMVNLQAELTARDSEAKALKDEITTCTMANTALTGETTRLQGELDQARIDYTALTGETTKLQGELDQALKNYTTLQTYVNGLGLTNVEGLRQENYNLSIALAQCTSNEANQKILQSSILPTDPEAWLTIAVFVLVGATLLIYYAIYKRWKKASILHRLYSEQGLSRRNRNSDVIEARFLHR